MIAGTRSCESEEILDFDTIIDEVAEAKKIAKKRKEKNPFLCDDSQLKTLWGALNSSRGHLAKLILERSYVADTGANAKINKNINLR